MIRIALPNKGRLADDARDLLERAGLEFESRGERALQASLGGEFLALFVRASDIPEFVADGAADAGITGRDLVEESGREVETLLDLGFGRCRLVVAAREDGGVDGIEALDGGVRVATSFPRLTRRYFEDRGLDVELVPVSGATEIAPHLGVADVIVDLTSTGSTLKVNGLVELATVLESSAVLIARPAAMEDPTGSPEAGGEASGASVAEDGARGQDDAAGTSVVATDRAPARRIRELVAALESVLRARDKRYLMANVPRATLAEVKRVLPGISGPTIVDVMDAGEHVAAHAVVDRREVYRVIAELKALGAEGILVTKIERLMP